MERLREIIHGHLTRLLTPVARGLHRLHARPNQVSVAGVLLSLAAAVLVVVDQPIAGGIAFLVAGACDLVDGILARLTGRATAFGAFLDSTLDRISEGVVFAAIAYRLALEGQAADAALVVLALLGSILVSYVRARAEGLGVPCKQGFVTRAERIVLLSLGLLTGLMSEIVYLLVALTAVTVGQRILGTHRRLTPRAAALGSNVGRPTHAE